MLRSVGESKKARALSVLAAWIAIGVSCANSNPVGPGEGGASSDGDSSATIDESDGYGGAGGYGGDGDVGVGDGGSGGGTSDSCGNGTVDSGEECDDGNTIDGDGCSACIIDCELGGNKNPANGHCYRVFPVTLTATAAEMECAVWGGAGGLGHLVSIGDAAEQTYLTGLVSQPGWIGAGDEATEGVFLWYDGTPFTFSHFAPGEPNDPSHIENCMFVHANTDWDDHGCTATEPSYICERRGAGTF